MIRGYYYGLQNDGSGVKTFTHTTEPSLNRIDRIILRLDLTARTIAAVKLIGAAGASPSAPALTRSSTVYELSLAQVLVQAGAAAITADDITDERADDDVCGLVGPEAMRKTVIQTMIEDEIASQSLISYDVQSLTETQQVQARSNIYAQKHIVAVGILKGTGTAQPSAAAPGTDYAVPVTEISAMLSVAAWSGSVAPFTQDIAVAGMTPDKKGVCVGLPATATDAQFEEAAAALLRVSAQGTNSITIKAHGEKPSAYNIPVLIQIKG